MLHFIYKGKDADGKAVSGKISSHTREAAINLLNKDGITIISIQNITIKVNPIMQIGRYLKLTGPSTIDLVLFCRHMYSLTKSGVPIIQSIRVVTGSAKNLDLELACESIVTGLESGKSLYTSMKDFPDVFPPIMISLVNVGENTGNLDRSFKQLAIHFERESRTTRQVKAALRYPIFVVIALVVGIAVVNIMVIPAFAGFFAKFNTELPLPTKILIGLSDATVAYWPWMLFGIILFVGWWVYFLRSKGGRLIWDKYKLKIPIIGVVFVEALLVRFTRSFALASKAGVPLLNCIDLAAGTTDNRFVQKKVVRMKSSIERGESLTNAAQKTGLFGSLVMQMIAIGEQTGEVDNLLEEASDYYEQELDYDLGRLSASIEPILITIVACMVLILALGIYLPMWNLSAAFKK